MQSLFGKLKNVQRGRIAGAGNFIKRWPSNPKVVFFGPPNVFIDELSQR